MKGKITIILYLSIALNILLWILVTCIVVKTNIMNRLNSRLGLTVYVPERADDNCVASWNSCMRKLNLDADVVFFGNSITEGGEWQEYFPDKKVVVLGYIGEDTKGMLRRVETIQSVHPEKVFLMAGINGLKNQTMEDFERWYGCLVDSVCRAVPESDIYVQSILPVSATSAFGPNDKIVWANKIVSRLAKERNLKYIDLHGLFVVNEQLNEILTTDGVHLNRDAYMIWVDAIKEYIEE